MSSGKYHESVTAVLIDDHAMFRQAFCRLLSKDRRIRVVGVAEDGERGLVYVRVSTLPSLSPISACPGCAGSR